MEHSDYRVIILAAGTSQRLHNLTKDKPKCFLELRGKRIIDYHLEYLNDRGFKQITIVVGYLRELFIETIGNRYKNLTIDYVISEDYATTNHSWSLFLTRHTGQTEQSPVLVIHADVFYDPKILDKLLLSNYDNSTSADNTYRVETGDECVVRGLDDIVLSIEFDSEKQAPLIVGEYLGLSKWSPQFITSFYEFLEDYFVHNGRKLNYEVPLNDFIKQGNQILSYVKTDGLAWVNINYSTDYENANQIIYNRIFR